jgi:hypothetical protein
VVSVTPTMISVRWPGASHCEEVAEIRVTKRDWDGSTMTAFVEPSGSRSCTN